MEIVKIFGVNIHNISFEETIELIKEYLEGNTLKTIYTPNTEIVMTAKEDNDLKDLLNDGDLIIPDGIGLIYGSKIRHKPDRKSVV